MFSSLQIAFADALGGRPYFSKTAEPDPACDYLAGLAEVSAADFTECPLKVRVKLNSPSL